MLLPLHILAYLKRIALIYYIVKHTKNCMDLKSLFHFQKYLAKNSIRSTFSETILICVSVPCGFSFFFSPTRSDMQISVIFICVRYEEFDEVGFQRLYTHF